MNESDYSTPVSVALASRATEGASIMINPINTSILRTNDAFSKQQRQGQRRKRKKMRDESEDSHDSPLNGEEEHLDLVA